MSWPKIRLSEISEYIRNGASIKQDSAAGGLPITRIETISERTVNLEKCGYAGLSKSDYPDYKLESGDILISHINSEKHLGKCAIFESDEYVIHGMNLLSLRPNPDKVYSKYLYYYLSSKDFLAKIPRITKKSVNQASFTVSSFKELEAPLPPLKEQQRIAAILDKADAIRRKRQQAIALADEFLRAVFLDMFGDPVTNPKGWVVRPLKELATVTTGNTPPRKEESYYGDYIEWIKSDNINTPSNFLTTATECLSEEGSKVGRVVEAGSVLVTCIAGSFDCIGNAAYADRAVAFNQQINALTPKNNVNSWFLYALVIFSKKHIQAASTNSMKVMVSKGKMEEIPMICPSSSQQEEFERTFLKFLEVNDKLKASSEYCASEFMALCKKAFSGYL